MPPLKILSLTSAVQCPAPSDRQPLLRGPDYRGGINEVQPTVFKGCCLNTLLEKRIHWARTIPLSARYRSFIIPNMQTKKAIRALAVCVVPAKWDFPRTPSECHFVDFVSFVLTGKSTSSRGRRPDHCQNPGLDRLREPRPRIEDSRQFRVDSPAPCIKCAGFCAAQHQNWQILWVS